jgi:hypothetical protein
MPIARAANPFRNHWCPNNGPHRATNAPTFPQIVGQKLLDRRFYPQLVKLRKLLRRRWDSYQVQIDASTQLPCLGLACARPSLGVQRIGHKPIDRMLDLATMNGLGQVHLGPHRRNKCPVLVVLGTLVDPSSQQFDLLGTQWLVQTRWRHHLIGVLRLNPTNHMALGCLARNDRSLGRFPAGQSRLTQIQPQTTLPSRLVDPMALRAVLR